MLLKVLDENREVAEILMDLILYFEIVYNDSIGAFEVLGYTEKSYYIFGIFRLKKEAIDYKKIFSSWKKLKENRIINCTVYSKYF